MIDKGKKALITGGTGFLGFHLVQRLLKEGCKVSVIARPTSSIDQFKNLSDKLTLFRYNGATEHIVEIMGEVKPDIVFHLATYFHAVHRPEDLKKMIDGTFLFGTQLLEAMSQCNTRFLVNAGTAWQHYQNRDYSPVCLHAAIKQAFEDIIQFYIEQDGLYVITLKLNDTYGPNDPRNKLFTLLNNAANIGKELVMSHGEQMLNLVYITDVVDAFWLAAQKLLVQKPIKSLDHEKYVVSSSTPIMLKDLVSIYERILRKNIPVKWGGRSYRPREVMLPWNKGKTLPGWIPKVDLERGLKLMLENIEISH